MNSKSKYVYLGFFIFGIVMIICSTRIMLLDGFMGLNSEIAFFNNCGYNKI